MKIGLLVSAFAALAISGPSAWATPTFAWANTATGNTADGGDQFVNVGSDVSGNVYAVGTVINGIFPNDYADVVIVKYNAAGALQWTRTYNGASGFDDVAYDAKVDAAGNVYVCGYTALDSNSFNTDILVLKVTSANVLSFASTYVPAGNNVDEYGYSIAVDGSGASYVGGEAFGNPIGAGLPLDAALYRVSSAGAFLWQRVFTGSAGDWDSVQRVVLAPNGDAIATGNLANTTNDVLVARVTSANALVFQDIFNSNNGTSYDWPLGLATNSAGNAYVCGYTYKATDRQESFVRAYSAAGAVTYTSVYDGNATGLTSAEDLVVDGAGNAYTVGITTIGGIAEVNWDQYIRKVGPTGSQLFVTIRNAGFQDEYYGVDLLANGNVVAAGSSALDGAAVPANIDGIVTEYTPSLAQVAVGQYNGSGNDWDKWYDVSVSGGTVLVCGFTYATFTDANCLVAKYTTSVFVNPSAYLFVTGEQLGGTLGSLFASDNDKLVCLLDEFGPNSNIEITATSPITAPSALRLHCESSSSRTDLLTRTELFNYSTNSWVQVDLRMSTIGDVSYIGTATGNIAQFVGPGNALKSRHRTIPTVDATAVDGWSVSLDRWVWELE